MSDRPGEVIDPAAGRLPTGGAAGMLTARDPARREAAWKFLRFSTSAEGTALMAKNTGYVPMNQIAIDDPRHLAEFCENGAKAVAEEATKRVVTPDFFARHSIADLEGRHDDRRRRHDHDRHRGGADEAEAEALDHDRPPSTRR